MPTANKTGQQRYRCEDCDWQWEMEVQAPAFDAECEKCGGLAFSTRFGNDEVARRLAALSRRLYEEDGPL